MASVRFENISKVFDKSVTAVAEFDLEIRDKEFVVLVGPSGCGKSTTLRMIAGLERPTTGKLYIGDTLVNDVAPKDRDIAMVFQNYALYPHMTVYENIAYGLRLRKFPKRVIDEKVREAARSLDITELLDRKPKALSGGQRQRVAIGRAIVREPKVFLMDEPLSNLDAKLRNQMRAEILTLRKRIDTTFVYVTHDQTEAMTLGDRIVIMKDGFIQQVGTPREVFAHPANQFVGGFIGTPQMNFFQGELLKENGRFWAQVGAYRVQLSDEKQERLFAADVQPQQVTVGVRPEHLQLAKAGIPAELGVREMMGSSVHLHLTAMEQDVVAVVSGMDDSGHFMNDIPAFGQVFLSFHGNAVHLFDPASETNLEWPSTHRKVDSENFMEETVLPD
ncbi:MAG: ABC transporter ATP-binding protein [Clostridiaceae bacterium]|nr:ABC transporter ATP-binding protein [Clostridia bacterium]MDY3869967.1 ABC transporter ATP-binding protein [Clostridiaceae bacterium]